MKISLGWLAQYVDISESPEELAHLLTMAGLEVSAIEHRGEGIENVVVARILEKGRHPNADKLSLCKVTDGEAEYPIVCGATNMVAGDMVALARVGAVLPGNFKIKKAKLRGEASEGMMCSTRELALGESHEGIIILPPDAPLGTGLLEYLGLPDHVIEVEITPNRPDWLSVVGVAREVAALTGRELRMPIPAITEAATATPASDETSVRIDAPDLCHRYAARLIKGVKIGPSPQWIQQRLESAGVRPISNVVDVTNYVLMELGHPLHAFDFNKLRGKRIVVRRAGEGEKFTTLDDTERGMGADNLMIADGEGAVAIAGVMGGQNSEVSEGTVDVLLESAYFHPSNIRRTGKELGLKTEASYRFERGADIEGLILSLERATELIVELAGGEVSSGIIDNYPTVHEKRSVTMRIEKAQAILGIEVDPAQAQGYLEGLGLTVTANELGRITATIPHFRVDLEREIDLIEEVARLKGYHEIPATMPRSGAMANTLGEAYAFTDKVRDTLMAAGLMETITLSFIDPADDDRIGLAQDSELRNKIEISNPLGRETSVMRTSLLPGLLRSASLNARRGNRDIAIFEVGHTFHPEAGTDLPNELQKAAGLLTGRRAPLAWWSDNDKLDFFDGKGVLESTLSSLGIKSCKFAPTEEIPWLQPGRAATFTVGEKQLGWIGEILPDILDPYELGAPTVAFSFDIEATREVAQATGKFGGLDKFPPVERDLAFVVDRQVQSGEIIGAITGMKIELVRRVVLFDAFEGGKVPEGKQSLAFRVTYRSDERTLTESEVSEIEAQVKQKLADSFGATLRDA